MSIKKSPFLLCSIYILVQEPFGWKTTHLSPVYTDQGTKMGFPDVSDSIESARNVGDLGSIPGQKDSLENRMVTHYSVLAWKIT